MADIINDLILDMNQRLSVTAIAVTHDMISAYKIADRIAMLHDGVIHMVGTPDEIRNTDDRWCNSSSWATARAPSNHWNRHA